MTRRSKPGKRPVRKASRAAARGDAPGDIHRLVADSSPEWEYITDEKVRLLYSSPSGERMTGLTTRQMLADSAAFYRLVHPDDLPLVLGHDSAVAGPADPAELEFRILHPTDGERWIGHACRPLFDRSGRFIGRRGTLRDITKRRRAERMLLMVQTALDHVGDMAFIVGEDGRPVYVNDAACRVLGYTREQFLDLTVRDFDMGATTLHWAAYWESIRAAGTRSFETLARARDGRTFPIEVTASHVEFEGRAYHCGFARDTSERKAAEAALAESEARFRAMANTVPDMLFTNMPDGRCEYVNERCCEYTGMSPGSLEGFGWLQIIHPGDRRRVEKAWAASVKTGTAFADEVRMRSADGTYRWFVDRAHPIRDAAGKVTRWFGSATDVDELKRAQEQLAEARATLEEKVRKRTAELQKVNLELTTEIAERRRLEREVLRIAEWEQRRIGQDLHDDLCQQLAAIAYLCDSLTPQIASASRAAGVKVRRIHGLLHRALAGARGLARGLSPLNLEGRGLQAALKDLAAAARASSGVTCRVACDDHLLRDDAIRSTHVYRIVQEAMSNAIRHGKARTIRIALRATPRSLRLTVEDDGRGVSRRPRRPAGMGLGSMHYRAGAMGGTFDIRQRPRGGTVVTCILPREVPAAENAVAPPAPARGKLRARA